MPHARVDKKLKLASSPSSQLLISAVAGGILGATAALLLTTNSGPNCAETSLKPVKVSIRIHRRWKKIEYFTRLSLFRSSRWVCFGCRF